MKRQTPLAAQDPIFSTEDLRALSLPAGLLGVLALVVVLIKALLLPSGDPLRLRLFGIIGISLAYAWVQIVYLLPHSLQHRWLLVSEALLNGILIPLLSAFVPQFGELIYYVLSAATLVFISVAYGRLFAYLFMVGNVAVGLLWAYPRLHPPYPPILYFTQLGLVALGIAETTLYARHMLIVRIRNLRILNRIARALALSIDREQVVALVKEAIQAALPADTYFLALLEGDVLRLELLFDEGKFFPPTVLPRQGGLGGWVLEHRQTLRLDNVPEEFPRLGIERRLIGQQKANLSWMGTPLESGGHLLGLVAVGSYRPHAFSRADQEMLENVARQVALALDNAYHHAEVEEQARRDSLTGAYNHGYFLLRLFELCRQAQQSGDPLSLIMLDVDHFKQYNDTYGHMMGDEVLRLLVTTIRRYIKQTDVVGRWGGEEFVIALPHATLEQALKVAERIRRTLPTFTLNDRQGKPVPAPTVSQGVAEFPRERDEPYALIDLADQRLYQAKAHGRNQVCPESTSQEEPART